MAATITIAALAGALATLNPCGLAMLAAFLASYLGSYLGTGPGAEEGRSPAAPTRALHAALVGLTLTGGYLCVFVAIGVPIASGLGQLSATLPWAGLGLGVLLTAAAITTLAGRRLGRRPRAHRAGTGRRGMAGVFGFGAGYGLASAGCSLPIFLAVAGAATTNQGVAAALAVFGAYATGNAIVLVALSMAAAGLRHQITYRLVRNPRLPQRINGTVLGLAGLYMIYYWGTAVVAPSAAPPDAGLTTALRRLAARLMAWAADAGREPLMGAAILIAVAILAALWSWARHTTADDTTSDDPPPAAACPGCSPDSAEQPPTLTATSSQRPPTPLR